MNLPVSGAADTIRGGSAPIDLRTEFIILVFLTAGLTALTSFLLYRFGSDFLKGETILTDQSLANYIGILFATPVALAGSYLAVKLAELALNAANRQNALSGLANDIAERQTPEFALSVEAAARYQEFKSMLITLPGMLRRAQRDRVFDEPYNTGQLKQMVEIIGNALMSLTASSLPAKVVELASRLESTTHVGQAGRERPAAQGQRYFEYAISSLRYDLSVLELALQPGSSPHATLRLQFLRLLHALYSLVNDIDDLFIRAKETVQPPELALSPLEKGFIDRVLPVAQLNRGLWLGADFDGFAGKVLSDLVKKGADYGLPMSETTIDPVHGGGVLIALHDSGHADAIARVKHMLSTQGKASWLVQLDAGGWTREAAAIPGETVPIFFIPEAATARLQSLYLFLNGDAAGKWSRYVILLDQVDQVVNEADFPKRLNLADSIHCWQLFAAVSWMLQRGENEFRIELGATGLHDMANYAAPFKRQLQTQQHLLSRGSKKHDDLLDSIARAASVQGKVEAPLAHAEEVIAMCEEAIDAALGNAGVGHMPGSFAWFDRNDTHYASVADTIELLAQPPLLSRPLFHFTLSDGVFCNASDKADLAFPGAVFLGVAYLDSTFGMPSSPLTSLLTVRATYHLF